MINKEQEQYILQYLRQVEIRQVEIRQQELHDEFFDHIVTSFETDAKENPELEIKTYIREVIHPGFGGAEGIKKIAKRKQREVNNFYRKQLFGNFRAYFRWPMILVALSLFLVLYKCFRVFEFKEVFLITITVSAIIPSLLGLGGFTSFYIHCKRKGLYYTTSVKNNVILTQLLIVSWAVHLPNFLKLGYNRELATLGDSPAFVLVLSVILTLFVILTLAYLKLIREHFDFKLSLT